MVWWSEKGYFLGVGASVRKGRAGSWSPLTRLGVTKRFQQYRACLGDLTSGEVRRMTAVLPFLFVISAVAGW